MASTLLCIFLESFTWPQVGRMIDRYIVHYGGSHGDHWEYCKSVTSNAALHRHVGASSHVLGADTKAPGAEGVLMKQEYIVDSYCHQKLPAIRESSLAGDHPVLSAEETIDFYGPCNQDPVGKDQLTAQRLENSDRRSK